MVILQLAMLIAPILVTSLQDNTHKEDYMPSETTDNKNKLEALKAKLDELEKLQNNK